MALYLPRKNVLNWFRLDVSPSVELMKSFVAGVERLVGESVATYREERYRDVHQGLDRETWDLDGIFEEHFPSLQRRSAFLSLWGFLEHELEKLCLLYQAEKGFTLAVSDLSDKGIDRSTSYLEKVAGLLGLKASGEWRDLKALQRIRNLIAHSEGKLLDSNGKPRDGIVNSMATVGFVKGEHEIIIEEGFLPRAVELCENYFSLIGRSIQAKESASSG